MFFIMGISQKEEKLKFDELTVCKCCGKYGHIEIYVTYMYFMFFFIPIFKWNKNYFVRMTCCNSVGRLDDEVGKQIEKGQEVSLDINEVEFNIQENSVKVCSNCGYTTQEDFKFCPKCSNKL